jgi:hypothetical protein
VTTTTAHLDTVREADATGEVAELYDELRSLFLGFVPDVFKLVSTRPDLLGTFVAGYRSMFDGGHLPRDAKEVIAVTVAHPAIPAEIRVLAELARDITQHAYRVTADDLDRVRAHGWDRPQLLEAVWVACLFNGIVRLADTFGLRDLGQLADDGDSDRVPHPT